MKESLKFLFCIHFYKTFRNNSLSEFTTVRCYLNKHKSDERLGHSPKYRSRTMKKVAAVFNEKTSALKTNGKS